MRENVVILLLLLYALLWIGGVVSYGIFGGPPATDSWTAAAFLWVAGLSVLVSSERASMMYLFGASAVALAAEIAGVATGKIFGTYTYTDALGFRILGVPVVITMAWCAFLGYVWHGTSHLRHGIVTRSAIGALWMTSLDLVVDPLAAGPLAYWRWADGGWYEGIPASNFAGWFAVSFVLLMFLNRRRFTNHLARGVGFSVLLFFTVLATIQAMVVPALIGVILMAVDLFFVPREQDELVRKFFASITRAKAKVSLLAILGIMTLSQTQTLYGGIPVRDQLTAAKQMLYEGSVLNDESLLLKAYDLIKSLHAQSPGTTTLYFLAQAECELVRIGLDAKNRDLYKRFVDGAIEKAQELVEQRKEWSEGYALLSSLYGYRIAHNPLAAFTSGPKAKSTAEEAVRRDSTNPRAWMVHGIVKLNTPSLFGGDKDEAVASLRKSVALFEDRTRPEWDAPEWGYLDALVWLGWAYEKTDRPAEAGIAYAKAVRAEPRATWIQEKFIVPLQRQRAATQYSDR
jgi:uncharacterized membrane protein